MLSRPIQRRPKSINVIGYKISSPVEHNCNYRREEWTFKDICILISSITSANDGMINYAVKGSLQQKGQRRQQFGQVLIRTYIGFCNRSRTVNFLFISNKRTRCSLCPLSFKIPLSSINRRIFFPLEIMLQNPCNLTFQ